MVSYCAGCNGKIRDQYLMKVLDKTWHSECLTCSECGKPLAEKCFTKDGKFYCKTDFYKLLSTGEEYYALPGNTFLCNKDYTAKHSPDDEVHSTTSDTTAAQSTSEYSPRAVWSRTDLSPRQVSPHQISSHQVSPRQMYPLSPEGVVSTTVHESPSPGLLKQKSPEACEVATGECVSKEKEDVSEAADSPDTSSSQVSTTTGKRRGPRTTIKSKQLEILKDAFNSTPKPTRNIREQLASKTGLNMRVIQVWFQNRRSKERRMKQMNLANRGRYGNPLSRELSEEYGYHQDHYFPRLPGECYYGDGHHHSVDPGFMQCLQVPGMDQPAIRALEQEHWASRHHYPVSSPASHPAMISSPGFPNTPLATSWASDSTSQIAFQT